MQIFPYLNSATARLDDRRAIEHFEGSNNAWKYTKKIDERNDRPLARRKGKGAKEEEEEAQLVETRNMSFAWGLNGFAYPLRAKAPNGLPLSWNSMEFPESPLINSLNRDLPLVFLSFYTNKWLSTFFLCFLENRVPGHGRNLLKRSKNAPVRDEIDKDA